MKFRIHYEINNQEDFFDIEENDFELLKEIVDQETRKRGLDEKKHNLWSEQL